MEVKGQSTRWGAMGFRVLARLGSSWRPLRTLFSTPVTRRKEERDNLFYEKYKGKLEGVQGDLSFIKARDMRSEAAPTTPTNPTSEANVQKPRVQGANVFSQPPDLNKVMKLELIENQSSDEITKIWVDYHKTRDCISAVLPSSTYQQLHAKSALCPLFVYPLPRNDGYEMWFAQFSGQSCYFTSLINYQMYPENAPTSFTITHYTEFLESKAIVLVHGEVDTKVLNTLEAQNLTNQMQLYYAGNHPGFYQLVQEFNHEPHKFDYNKLIEKLTNKVKGFLYWKTMLAVLIWRVWKWILHCVTGHCEVYRIALSREPVAKKVQPLLKSLKTSQSKILRDVVSRIGVDVNADSAVETIVREKHIKLSFQSEFRTHAMVCFTLVSGVRELYVKVENTRKEAFDQSNEKHEQLLMELWSVLMPATELMDRITPQWQDIGFQGNNPATDFRGMGLLGLQALLYFSKNHEDRAKSLLLHSHHPQYWYPFAVVGIDLTGEVYSWLKNGSLDLYFYSNSTQWPLSLEHFMEVFSFLIVNFDSFWRANKPENIMAFSKVKAEFLEQLKQDIDSNSVVMAL